MCVEWAKISARNVIEIQHFSHSSPHHANAFDFSSSQFDWKSGNLSIHWWNDKAESPKMNENEKMASNCTITDKDKSKRWALAKLNCKKKKRKSQNLKLNLWRRILLLASTFRSVLCTALLSSSWGRSANGVHDATPSPSIHQSNAADHSVNEIESCGIIFRFESGSESEPDARQFSYVNEISLLIGTSERVALR